MPVDPVCQMEVDVEQAAARVKYEKVIYYFCSELCRDAFVAQPQQYATRPPCDEHAGHCGH